MKPQVKVCGFTDIRDAEECSALGIDAVGLVFFPKSPRNVSERQALEISRAVPADIQKIGVFVNESFSGIMRKMEKCGLTGVQLHGKEPPELVDSLRREGVFVIKALFMGGSPDADSAGTYDASAFLVECSRGKLPGGNAMVWNYSDASGFRGRFPFILAGGLSPENISAALSACLPDAVDISSGVEISPGRKSSRKVQKFLFEITRHFSENPRDDSNRVETSLRNIF